MADTTRRHFLTLAILAPALAAEAQLIGNNPGGWSIRGTDPIEMFYGDRRVTAYHPAYGSGIPYFAPIVGPNAKTYTDTSPKADAPEPLGAWFALSHVNGYDFRNESEGLQKAGKILHKGMNGVIIKGETLSIRTKSEWVDKEDPIQRICSDRREVTLFHLRDDTLVFDLVLELIADAGDLELGPEPSATWSIRPIPGLRLDSKSSTILLRNSHDETGANTQEKAASWLVCHGQDSEGKPISLGLLDHPTNLNSPAVWTFGKNGVISANLVPGSAANAPATPHLIPNGESRYFRYRMLFHHGDPSSLDMAKVFESYSKK